MTKTEELIREIRLLRLDFLRHAMLYARYNRQDKERNSLTVEYHQLWRQLYGEDE